MSLYKNVTQGLKNIIIDWYFPVNWALWLWCNKPHIFNLGHSHEATFGHSNHESRFMESTVCWHVKLLFVFTKHQEMEQKNNRVVTHPSENMFNLINLQMSFLQSPKWIRTDKLWFQRHKKNQEKKKQTNWSKQFNSHNLYKIFTHTPAGSFCFTSCLSHTYTSTLSQYRSH